MGKRFIDKILLEADKTYDEKMVPLIIKDVDADFEDAIRQGEKAIITLEKEIFMSLMDVEDLDIDQLANAKMQLKNGKDKIEVIKKLKAELFAEVEESDSNSETE